MHFSPSPFKKTCRLFFSFFCTVFILAACGQATPISPTSGNSPYIETLFSQPATATSPIIQTRQPSPTFTPVPPTITPVKITPTRTPVPTNTRLVTPTSTPLVLDKSDISSVLRWIVWGCTNHDIAVFAQLLPADKNITIGKTIDGGQIIARGVFLDDLQTRFKSNPFCDGYSLVKDQIFLWTSEWDPTWQQTQNCDPDCVPLQPGFQSRKAAFLINKINGQWELSSVILRDFAWFSSTGAAMKNIPVIDCGQAFSGIDYAFHPTPQPSAAVCPGILPPRLSTGKMAFVNPIPPLANRVRKDAGKDSPPIGSIQAGGIINVLDGPVCTGYQAWWKVEDITTGLTGWTAEGDSRSYWLVPCTAETNCRLP